MNGLIPKRSCVNPVLITTFGLEPSGHKKRGCRSAGRGAKRQKVGLGNRSPINMEVPLGTKRDEGEGAVARERSDRKGLGNTFPNQAEGATGHKKMRVKTLIFCAQSRARTGTSF